MNYEVLEQLRRIVETHPELRIGQVIANAMRDEKYEPHELFYIEDGKLLTMLWNLRDKFIK
jgi:hypothetical protein